MARGLKKCRRRIKSYHVWPVPNAVQWPFAVRYKILAYVYDFSMTCASLNHLGINGYLQDLSGILRDTPTTWVLLLHPGCLDHEIANNTPRKIK